MTDNDSGAGLRDIVVLILLAIILRLVETLDRDVPGWWLEGEKGDDD